MSATPSSALIFTLEPLICEALRYGISTYAVTDWPEDGMFNSFGSKSMIALYDGACVQGPFDVNGLPAV